MRIYEIGRALPEKKTGMIGLFEFQQAKALYDAENEVHYIYFDSRSIKVNRGIKTIERNIEGVQVHGFMMQLGGLPEPLLSTIKSFFYIRLLEKVLNNVGEPDIVHVHFPLLSITPRVWDFLKNSRSQVRGCVPSIRNIYVTEHWTAVQNKKLNARHEFFLQKVYRETDGFMCVSEPLKKSIQELCGDTREVLVVPNMVSELLFFNKLEKHEGFRFISVGRLVEVKAFELLIDAFADAFKGNEKISLTIVGGGTMMVSLKKQISNLHMEKQIFLVGIKSSEEIAEIFRKSDCYVSASRLETFGVPVAEAWMVGLPCISADNTPIREYFTEKNGMLFKVDNRKSLRQVLVRMVDEFEKYDACSIAEEAGELFSSKNVAKRLLEIFRMRVS